MALLQSPPLSTLAPTYTNQLRATETTVVQADIYPGGSKDPCKKPCDTKPISKCDDPCKSGRDMGWGWGWLGALILWFIVFTVLFWLIYYSLKPSFVLQTDSNQVDTAKVLLAAVISAIILVIIIWLIKLAVTRQY